MDLDDELSIGDAPSIEDKRSFTAAVLLIAVPVYLASILFIIIRPVLYGIGVPAAYTAGSAVIAAVFSILSAAIFLHNGSLRHPFEGASGWLYSHLVVVPLATISVLTYYELYLFSDQSTTLAGHIALGSMVAALALMGLVALMSTSEDV